MSHPLDLKSFVTDVPDFPIKGVTFRDISPLLENPEAFSQALTGLVEGVDLANVDAFVGIESRGFILAAALASKFNKGFIPLRKAGKLPPPVRSESYALEYGTATLEMKLGQGRVVVVDDVLATGGTLQAGLSLCEKCGYEVEAVTVLINLKFLNQMTYKEKSVISVLDYV
ncbi:MAG: adenine phosphoribosyltransferase [Proteobacteria bacterium]|nr:MAG: adenine phosphoribosyltransferase [Pseudomonadota bacterium]